MRRSLVAYIHLMYLVATVLVLASACAPLSRDLPSAPQGVVPETDLAKDLPAYRIQVGDQLDIKLLLNPELDETVVVRPDGMVSTAIVQDVLAYGLTPRELQSVLVEGYKKQLSKPELKVIVKYFAPTRVYVLGEVNNPGELVSVGPNLSLMQALAKAGGVKDTAETAQIVIMRRGAGEEPKTYSANFDKIASGENPLEDVRLAAYDVVYVSKSSVAEAGKTYDQYFKKFVLTTFGVNYQLNNSN